MELEIEMITCVMFMVRIIVAPAGSGLSRSQRGWNQRGWNQRRKNQRRRQSLN